MSHAVQAASQYQLPAGYTLRPPTLADTAAITVMLNAWSQAEYGNDDYQEGDLEREWESHNFDHGRDVRIVENTEGQLVGYLEVWDAMKPMYPVLWGAVHPDYKGQGIGTALRHWGESRAQQSIAKCPPEVRVAYHSWVRAGDEDTEALLEGMGMTPQRRSWTMLIEMDEAPTVPPLPDGISLRTMQPGELPRVVEAVDAAFRDHFGHVEMPAEERLAIWENRTSKDPEFDPSLWLLAIDDSSGEIAGMSLCRPKSDHDEQQGWVNTLGVLRPWRRRGLAKALLLHSFRELYQRGQRRVGLGVDAQSLTGATELYKKAGMQVDRDFIMYEKELRPGVEMGTTSLEG